LFALILSFPLAKAEIATNPEAESQVEGEVEPRKTSKPNILVIVVDDQGYADLGAYSHAPPVVLTPNMDRLAAGGVLFTHADGSERQPSTISA